MLRIGLTGNIGSGKTTVATMFAKLGITIIDADEISHQLSQKPAIKQQIIDHFGPQAANSDGDLDRAFLRQQVFADAKKRQWLEQLLHPLIYQEMEHQAAQAKSAYSILVIPLLLETKHQHFVDRILAVLSPEQQQLERLQQRDDLTVKEIKQIMVTQASRQQQIQQADDLIYNNSTLENLEKQVQSLHAKYLTMA